MCDDDSFDDMVAYRLRADRFSRRGFGSLSLGAGLASLLPIGCKSGDSGAGTAHAPTTAGDASAPTPNAVATTESEVSIATPDGSCDAYFVHPTSGAAPAVLVWPDIFGLRPTFRQMGKRLAESGYAVLVVNPFYRKQKAPTSSPHADMEDPATREGLMALAKSLTPETEVTDAKALTAWLDQQPSVDKSRKMGTTGYCMGGPQALRTAATNPDRVGAAATFHGGGLVTDKPDSPHLLIPKMKGHFLIAIAAGDDAKQPDAKTTLKAAFAQASLPANVEVFEGTKHGWCPPDSHAYDRDAAEKAWGRLPHAAEGRTRVERRRSAPQSILTAQPMLLRDRRVLRVGPLRCGPGGEALGVRGEQGRRLDRLDAQQVADGTAEDAIGHREAIAEDEVFSRDRALHRSDHALWTRYVPP